MSFEDRLTLLVLSFAGVAAPAPALTLAQETGEAAGRYSYAWLYLIAGLIVVAAILSLFFSGRARRSAARRAAR